MSRFFRRLFKIDPDKKNEKSEKRKVQEMEEGDGRVNEVEVEFPGCVNSRGLMANVELLKNRGKNSFHRSLHRAASDEDAYLFESLLMGAQKNTEKYAGNIAHQQNLLKIVVNGQDKIGRTPLHYLAIKGNWEMCDILHRYSKVQGSDDFILDPTITDMHGATPLHYATSGDLQEDLEQKGTLEETFDNILCTMVKEEDCLGKLLRWSKESRTKKAHGEKSNLTIYDKQHFVHELRDDKNMSPLHWACKYNNVKAVIRLLADIRMCRVADFRHFEECKDFLKQIAKAALQVQDLFGRTPLHIAIAYNANLTACLLLELDVDPLICNNFGETPLHVAAAGGNIPFVKRLLKEDRRLLFMTDNVKQTPLHQALTRNRLDVAQLLLEAGSDNLATVKDVHGHNALHKAATIKSTDALNILLSYDLNINELTQQEQTPLHVAAKMNNIKVLKFLLENYPDSNVNQPDEMKMTPLLLAAKFGSEDCFQYLFSIDETNKLAENHLDMTCLHIACKQGCTGVVKKILKNDIYKSLLNLQDINGNTAMHHAAEKGHHMIMEALLETNDCDVTLKNADERAIVHLSARTGRPSEFELLLQKDSAQAQIRDFKDNTPLIDAAKCRNTANVQVLLNHRAEVNATNHRGYTALGYCSMRDTVSTAKILIKEGASIEASFPEHLSPLQIACFHGSVQMVKFLLNIGADVSYRSTDKNGTAIEIAIDKGHEACVIEIIKSKKWKTALRSLNFDTKKKKVSTPIRTMFETMPGAALVVLDRCLIAPPETDPDDEEYHLILDLEFFDDAYSSNTWESLDRMGEISLSTECCPCYKENGHLEDYAVPYSRDSEVLFENHPLQSMIESGHEDLLDHPLTRALVRYKWRAFGRTIYYLILIMNFFYVFLLTSYMVLQVPPDTVNVTQTGNGYCYQSIKFAHIQKADQFHRCTKYRAGTSIVLQIFILFLATISILKEMVQIKRAKWHYFLQFDNLVELITFGLSIPTVLDVNEKGRQIGIKEAWQWQLGSAAVLSAWLMLALLVRKLPVFGIYVIMVGDIIKSFAKAFLIFTIFLVGFGIFFYLTLGTQVAFHTWYLAILRTLVMMLGELDYTDMFFPEQPKVVGQVYQSSVLDIGYVLFIFLMPIIVMNLLVGLAVDDIKSVMENATKEKLIKKIQLALDVEFMMPPSWRRYYTKGYYKIHRKEKKRHYYDIKDYFVPDVNAMFCTFVEYLEEKEKGSGLAKPTATQEKMLSKLSDLSDQSKAFKSSLKKLDEKLKANQKILKATDEALKKKIEDDKEEQSRKAMRKYAEEVEEEEKEMKQLLQASEPDVPHSSQQDLPRAEDEIETYKLRYEEQLERQRLKYEEEIENQRLKYEEEIEKQRLKQD